MNRDTAASNSGGSVIDTETPVLDGGIFSQYDTVFFHGTMAETGEYTYGVTNDGDFGSGHSIVLNPYGFADLNCPFFSYDSKQGGIYPAVRYLGLQYKTYGEAEIQRVDVYNGLTFYKSITFYPPLRSTSDSTVQVINLGEWMRFNRGLNMCFYMYNPSPTNNGEVKIGGYGARFEW